MWRIVCVDEVCVFFFQAEDGIRDWSVTGVQTCALPIFDSGPVSGVTGSLYLGKLMGLQNIITTDMGGTSFDVGIIHGGQPEYSFVSNVVQYEYFLPKVDIQAIGSGGGSLARVDA